MLWIGLTGGIACGKSSVTRLLRTKGLPVIDADELAREVVRAGTKGLSEIAQAFGPEAIGPDGELDRKRIGEWVFGHPENLAKLEAIVHPRVRELQDQRRRELEARGEAIAFYDVPLLFEKKMEPLFDRILAVVCSPEPQIARLMARNGLSRAEAEVRIRSQVPADEKARRAHDVIWNDGDLASLEAAVDGYLAKIRASQGAR